MNRVGLLGSVLAAFGLAGYVMGVLTPYPGRAFAVTLFMVGVALVAMRAAFESPGVAE